MAIATGTALALGAGAGLLGAGISSAASNSAANTQADAAVQAAQIQADAAAAASQTQMDMFQQGQVATQPFREAGTQAVGQLSGLFNDPAKQAAYYEALSNSPMMQQQIQQAEQGMLRGASATGGLRTGQANVALGQISPMLQMQNYQSNIGGLMGLAGIGSGVSQQTAGLASGVGQGIGNMQMAAGNAGAGGMMNAANAAAQNQMNQAQIWGGAFGDLAGLGFYAANRNQGSPTL